MKNQILFRKKCVSAFRRLFFSIFECRQSVSSVPMQDGTVHGTLRISELWAVRRMCENPVSWERRVSFSFSSFVLLNAVLFLCFTTGCGNGETGSLSKETGSDGVSAEIATPGVSDPGVSETQSAAEQVLQNDEDLENSKQAAPLQNEENADRTAEEGEFSFEFGEEFVFEEGELASGEKEGEISQEELDKYIEDEEYMFEPLTLGDPIFENVSELVRFHPEKPIWVDKKRENVVLQGWVCQKRAMLEFFLCQGTGGIRTFPYEDETGKPATMLMFNGTKCHESVLCADVPGHFIHTALLALGAEPGKPVQFHPEFVPPTGDEIEILVRWKDEDGNTVEKRGQELIADSDGNVMQVPWVFAGSLFYEDGEGNRRYAAEMEGEFIGVSNFPSCILDIPQASSSSNESLVYVANAETLPERGTPVTVILRKTKKEGELEDAVVNENAPGMEE